MLRKSLSLLLAFCVTLAVHAPSLRHAKAASFSNMSVTLSSHVTNEEDVDYEIQATATTTENIQLITFQFGVDINDDTRPAGLDLTGATLDSYSGIGSGWNLVVNQPDGLLRLENASAQSIPSTTVIQAAFSGITNPALRDCDPDMDVLQDTCYVTLSTYSDTGSTLVDQSTVLFHTAEDPYMIFEVENVPLGETHNGVTTTLDTTSTSISYGHLTFGAASYGTQKLTIRTNAPHGYTVYASLRDPLTGGTGSNYFNAFGATDATYLAPQPWSSPTGTSQNVNSGWIGINTSDTRLSGWSSASGKFAPFSAISEPVARSNGPELTNKVIYVSYAIEANRAQPADFYSQIITYNVQAVY